MAATPSIKPFCVVGLIVLGAAGFSCTVQPPGGGGPDRSPRIILDEFSVTAMPIFAPRGVVTFEVTNIGDEDHEFLVIATALDPEDLPINDDGSYNEGAAGTEVLGEIDLLAPGETDSLTLNLDPGNYVLICNMVEMEDDGAVEAHYELGMRTRFTVTD